MPVLGYSSVLNTSRREWACVTMKHCPRYHQVVVASHTESQESLYPAKPHSQPRILNVAEVTAKGVGGLHALSLAELPVTGRCQDVCGPTQRLDGGGPRSPAESCTVPWSVGPTGLRPQWAHLQPGRGKPTGSAAAANRRSEPLPTCPHPTTLTAKL